MKKSTRDEITTSDDWDWKYYASVRNWRCYSIIEGVEPLVKSLPEDLRFAVKRSTPSTEKKVVRRIKSRLQIERSLATEIFATVKKHLSS